MGLIKTAMMSGVALYGVKELSKAAQSRNNNNQNNNYGPPLARRDAYYDDRRSYDARRSYEQPNGDWSRRDVPPSQYPSDDKRQRALADNQGSNQDHYNDNNNYYYDRRSYDERSAYVYEDNNRRQQPSTPPPYREYPGGRGYIEGEVLDDPTAQRQQSGGKCGAAEVMSMLGSQLGGARRKDRKGASGMDGQLGSLLSGLSKR